MANEATSSLHVVSPEAAWQLSEGDRAATMYWAAKSTLDWRFYASPILWLLLADIDWLLADQSIPTAGENKAMPLTAFLSQT